MSTVVNPLEPGRRPRAGFGTLTGGMVMRGLVPAQVMYGAHRPPPDRFIDGAIVPGDRLPELPELQCILPSQPRAKPKSAPLPATPECAAPEPAAPQPAAADPVAPGAAPAAEGGRRAMTVRLEAAHHMRLRVLSSYQKRSAQQIVTAALEQYFAQLPATVPGNCACLKAGRRSASK